MDKLFLDVNVILDVALTREPHWKASQKILDLVATKKASGSISALSCAILYYLIQKESNAKRAISYIKDLLSLVSIVEVNQKTLEKALEYEIGDFEDGIQIACAETCQADYLITRDPHDFEKSSIPSISPAQYVVTFVKELS